jgi:hypothetical protein
MIKKTSKEYFVCFSYLIRLDSGKLSKSTTSTLTLSPEDLANQPYAGAIFAIETGIKGHLEHAFAD